MMQTDKFESAKSLILELGDIRETYGHWMRNMNLLSLSFNEFQNSETRDFIIKSMNEMRNICISYDSKYESHIQNIYTSNLNLKEQSLKILECFETELSMQLQQKRKNFEKHLYDYVKAEQMRINTII